MRLIESSKPGEVERSDAIHLLSERAVLTRAVCHELIDRAHRGWRVQSALTLLLRWVDQHFPRSGGGGDVDADQGLDRMVVPDDCLEVMQEIRDGAQVADALRMSYTADTSSELEGDMERLRERLEAYWAKHRKPSIHLHSVRVHRGSRSPFRLLLGARRHVTEQDVRTTPRRIDEYGQMILSQVVHRPE